MQREHANERTKGAWAPEREKERKKHTYKLTLAVTDVAQSFIPASKGGHFRVRFHSLLFDRLTQICIDCFFLKKSDWLHHEIQTSFFCAHVVDYTFLKKFFFLFLNNRSNAFEWCNSDAWLNANCLSRILSESQIWRFEYQPIFYIYFLEEII
jgi:hypothetical protein